MSDSEQQIENAPDAAENTEPNSVPYNRLKEVIDQRNDLKARLAQLEKAEAEREQKEKEEAGRYQEVIEELKQRAQLVDDLEAQTQRYTSLFQEQLDDELSAIPEAFHDIIPDGTPEVRLKWVRSAKKKGLFTPKQAPETDAGTTGARPEPKTELPEKTKVLLEAARRSGYNIDADKLSKHINKNEE